MVVDFDDHLLGVTQQRRAHPGRRRQVHTPVGRHIDRFDYRHVDLAEESELDHLRHMREVHVYELRLLLVDALAQLQIGRASCRERGEGAAVAGILTEMGGGCGRMGSAYEWY